MNVKQLKEAIKDLPDDMRVDAWTVGDTEFEVRIATVIKSHSGKDRLFLGDDPYEFTPSEKERLLYADDVEDER